MKLQAELVSSEKADPREQLKPHCGWSYAFLFSVGDFDVKIDPTTYRNRASYGIHF